MPTQLKPIPTLTVHYLTNTDEFLVMGQRHALTIWARETLQGIIQNNPTFSNPNRGLTIYCIKEQMGQIHILPATAAML